MPGPAKIINAWQRERGLARAALAQCDLAGAELEHHHAILQARGIGAQRLETPGLHGAAAGAIEGPVRHGPGDTDIVDAPSVSTSKRTTVHPWRPMVQARDG